MRVDEVYQPDLAKEAQHVLGSTDVLHPGIAYLFQESGDTYLAGPLQGAQLPIHYDYQDIRRTPRETRRGLSPFFSSLSFICVLLLNNFWFIYSSPNKLQSEFQKLGWKKIIGFQTRNPMHRAHRELTVRAASIKEGKLAYPNINFI